MERTEWWYHALAVNLTYWWSWGLLTPLILAVATRVPFGRSHWRRAALVHGPASLIFAAVHILMMTGNRWMFLSAQPGGSELTFVKTRQHGSLLNAAFYDSYFTFDWDVLVYWAIVGIWHGFEYYGEVQRGAVKEAQLETQLVGAQLDSLQHQLHPHFLFNTLHAISTLMHKDVDAADRMLARLSDLLRLTLNKVGAQELTLKEELEFLQKYVEIEQTRFRDRLEVEIDVEPETLSAQVPYLILQPLVENAVRHGIAPHASGGRILIRATRARDRLKLEVGDDGPGLSEQAMVAFKQGIGLNNTRARLTHLYGDRHQFSFRQIKPGGLIVQIFIPWRVADVDDVERGAA